MSFLRHREIYPSDGDPGIVVDVPSHRLDEFPVGYFSASCTPALLASASPLCDKVTLLVDCFSATGEQCLNWLSQPRGQAQTKSAKVVMMSLRICS
jgi:hypothetical protein